MKIIINGKSLRNFRYHEILRQLAMQISTCNLPTCYSYCHYLFIPSNITFCPLLIMCHHFDTKLQKLIHNYYRNNLKTIYASLQLNLSIIKPGNHRDNFKKDLYVIAYILCQNRSLLKRYDVKFYY